MSASIQFVRIGHEQLAMPRGEEAKARAFYGEVIGMTREETVALIVNGLDRDVLQQLPMEFMAETQKLIGISLEGSLG